MKKTLLTLALTTSALLAQNCSYINTLKISDIKEKDIDCIAKDLNKNIQSKLPFFSDNNQKATKSFYENKVLTIHHTNNEYSSSKKFGIEMNIYSKYCSEKYKKMYDYGFLVKHIIKDSSNKEKLVINADKKFCN